MAEELNAAGAGRPLAALTFDDGFQNNYDIVFPILLKEQIPVTIFPVTGLVDSEDTIWFCRLHRALTETGQRVLRWRGLKFSLSTAWKRARASMELQKWLKKRHPTDLLDAMRAISRKLGVDPDAPIPRESPFRMLTREAIVRMADSGLVEFGAHTENHVILSRVSRRDQETEIRRSIERLERMTGRSCKSFAYPNGFPEDFTAQTMKLLEETGIETGVTAIRGINNQQTPHLMLRRSYMGTRVPWIHARYQVMVLRLQHHLGHLFQQG
jgi:peptidoglycan/xylan/chitin deacetylase (PgdA/CDA1 family)